MAASVAIPVTNTTAYPTFASKVGAAGCMQEFNDALKARNWMRWKEACWQLGNTDTDPWSDDASVLSTATDQTQVGNSDSTLYPVFANKATALVAAREAILARNWEMAMEFLSRVNNTNCSTWADDTVRNDP